MRIKRSNLNALDHECAEYLRMKAALEALGKKLFRAARSLGVAPQNAAKSRYLAGSLYEVLATIGARTEVDQAAALRVAERINGVFESAVVYSLRPDWERATMTKKDIAAVRACLRTKPVRRLTVRPRKARTAQRRRADRVIVRRAA